jgi:hypothetical protein
MPMSSKLESQWLSCCNEMNHVIQLKQHSIFIKDIYEKTKPMQDLSQKPLYDNHSANNCNRMKPALNVRFFLPQNNKIMCKRQQAKV